MDSMEKAKAERPLIEANIEKFGCHLVLIEETGHLPGFVYSIGLYQKFGHPELICFGLKTDVMAGILNHACDLIQKGQVLETYTDNTGFLHNYSVQFIPVSGEYYHNYVGYGGWFYNGFDFPLLQLVWPDKQHHFPWHNDFNPDWKFKQPLLDRDTGFKFYEEKNLGVYTTRQVLNGEPVLYVYHNEDGDWQFHNSDNPDAADGAIVCLEEMLQLDPSLNDLYYLDYGQQAWRKSKNDEWVDAETQTADE